MATAAELRGALSFATRADNLFYPEGRTIGGGTLIRLQAALKNAYSYPGGTWPPGRPDADDVAAWLCKQASALVRSQERITEEAKIPIPREFKD